MSTAASSASPSFVIRDLFPTNEVHLIFGPSFVGKTTLLFQIIEEWRHGRDVFGYHSHPAPFCYVECHHSQSRTWRHMRHLGIDPGEIPHFSLLDTCTNSTDYNIDTVVKEAKHRVPNLRVLFIDGLSILCSGKITEQRAVAEYMLRLAQICKEHKLTIIGVMSSVKSREGSSYASTLERLPGSSTWASMTGTKLVVEPVDARNPVNASRTILFLIRERAPNLLFATFTQSGMLGFSSEPEASGLDSWLASLPLDSDVTTQQIQEAAKFNKVPRSTMFYWLDSQLKLGTLVKVRKGKYHVPPAYNA
jgi:hypothetical protein